MTSWENGSASFCLVLIFSDTLATKGSGQVGDLGCGEFSI